MLNVNVEENGSEVVFYVEGKLDTMTSPQLEAEIEKRIDSANKIIIDVKKLQYVSSAGLRVFLAADQAMEEKGGEMNMRNVPESVMDIFDMTGFTNTLRII